MIGWEGNKEIDEDEDLKVALMQSAKEGNLLLSQV